ncbi:alpha/beta fold hydrolase [Nocardioides sp. CN2-186]|uniref:alpha/beta fold hydrolase n=1 Tax=Nocardioides tweenelious TaxID=3156607 RepID=UPI0032B4A0E5
MTYARRVLGALVAVTLVGTLAALAPSADAGAPATAAYTKKTLHLKVHVGPRPSQVCDVVFDLYRPHGVDKKHRAPAVLTTNGFGGSKDDQASTAQHLVEQGYVVLSYSGLGFGGSSCRIELDSFAWDGRAAKQLVTFLGGGSAATDGTTVDYVRRNAHAQNGKTYDHDPVVGMIGGSYGGGAQLAGAAVDPRIDAIIPIITWNNLAYSLAPNNATLSGTSLQYTTPGITKANEHPSSTFGSLAGWLNLLWFAGTTSTRTEPLPPSTCPNYDQLMCSLHDQLVTDGYPDAATLAQFRTNSISSRMPHLRAPVLLEQGENDSLFNLQEAVATYSALRAQQTPVRMVWQSWGHSGSGDSAAEGPALTEINDNWFRYYLKGEGPAPALNFSFYRPWMAATDQPFASTDSYPLTGEQTFDLSGTRSFTTPAAGAPTSVTQLVSIRAGTQGMNSVDVSDPDGTYASYETPPLSDDLDVVGVPSVTVHVAAPSKELTAGPDGTLGLFFRIEDIAPDGTVTLPDRLVSAARFPTSDAGQDVTVKLPGIAYRFPAGHTIRLVIAGSDSAYSLPNPDVSVTIGAPGDHPGVLSLPVASTGSFTDLKVTE